MSNRDDEWIEKLILEGALEVSAVDENGELLYQFTDKLQEVDPLLYRKAYDHLYTDAKVLWINGFIEMNITDPNPKIILTRKAFLKEEVEKLPLELQKTLSHIIEALLR